MKGSESKVYCCIGDGAMDEGWTTEAVKYAISMDLPITYICEDNNRSVCSSKIARWGVDYGYDNDFRFNGKLMLYRYECGYPHAGVGEFVDLDTIS
jgi:transketolase